MKLYKITPKKNTAQAMVEFAIVLPLLLLLLYGLLEAGRLLFMYSTVVTASRQAARYGSATGQGGDYSVEGGPNNSTLARFQDCYGIKRAAQRVDFLNAFDDDDIYITYDNGPGTGGLDPLITPPAAPPWRDVCDGTGDINVDPNSNNSTRIVITIGGDFNPIIPRIVPFIARTRAGSNPIKAVSARTIIRGVAIEVTPPPGAGGGGGGLSLSIAPTPGTYTAAGESIVYKFTLINNGTTSVTGPFTITLNGAPFTVDCSAATSPLAGGASTDCTDVTYVTTSTDVTTGYFQFTGTASASGGVTSSTVTSKITLATAFTGITITSITTNPSAYLSLGEVITYTYNVTNGVTPVSGLAITDDKVSGISCALTTLPPSTPTSCTGTYTVTQADMDAGSIVNTATASATDDAANPISSGLANGLVIRATPSFTLTKSVTSQTVTPGDTVTYNFTLTNTGNVPLSGVSISDPLLGGAVPGCSTSSLAAGAPLTCSAPYVVRSIDVTSGKIINTATGSGTFSTWSTPATASATLNVNMNTLSLEVSASPPSITGPNQSVTYTYKLTNGSGQALQGPYVLTGDLPAALNNCFTGTLAANGGTQSCTATYSAQAAFDSGATSIQNTNIKVTACVFNTNCRNQNQVQSNTVSAPVVTITGQGPAMTLQVSVSTALATNLNQQITYTYRLTNSGNVTLKQPFALNDPKLGNITCSTTDIAPGAFKDCTKTYNITQPDIDAGSIPTRLATASATFGTQTITTTAPVPKVTTFQGSRLKLEIFANPTTYLAAPAIQPITYTYRLTNTGTNTLTSDPQPYLTTSQQSDGTTTRTLIISSCPSESLAPGDSIDCTATDELNGPPGSKITNTATAKANDGISITPITSNTATVTVSNPVLACNTVTAEPISIPSGSNTMSMTITNPNAYAIAVSSVEVTWNHDRGAQGNSALRLDRVDFGGVKVWDEVSLHAGPSLTFTPSPAVTIPAASGTPGTSTIVFTFNGEYRNRDNTERIKVNFSTAGCESSSVQQPPPTP